MKKNNVLKVFAVILAFIIWLLVSLLKEQIATIYLPVRIVNVPENIYIFENEEILIPVLVQGTGINILIFYLADTTIDYNGSDFVMGSNLLDMDRIASSLPIQRNLALSTISTENNFLISTDRLDQKRVPVIFEFFTEIDRRNLLENNYYFEDFFVTISGPSAEIRRIDHAFTEKISSDILRQRRKNIRLQSISEHIVIVPTFIELQQASEVISTKTFTFLPIFYDEDSISIFPQRVTVIIEGKLDSLNLVTPHDINAFVHATDLEEFMELDVRFIKPDYVRIVDYTPARVSARAIQD
ncbi:MAG: hypothetical protein FWG98_03795 [Candidatus Cloacimonetes bacterium]|nr:hypothetical protein [Candidatus Cloacimonadota bacterium]